MVLVNRLSVCDFNQLDRSDVPAAGQSQPVGVDLLHSAGRADCIHGHEPLRGSAFLTGMLPCRTSLPSLLHLTPLFPPLRAQFAAEEAVGGLRMEADVREELCNGPDQEITQALLAEEAEAEKEAAAERRHSDVAVPTPAHEFERTPVGDPASNEGAVISNDGVIGRWRGSAEPSPRQSAQLEHRLSGSDGPTYVVTAGEAACAAEEIGRSTATAEGDLSRGGAQLSSTSAAKYLMEASPIASDAPLQVSLGSGDVPVANPPRHALLRAAQALARSRVADVMSTSVIVVNTALMASRYYRMDAGVQNDFETANVWFTGYFLMEMVVKLAAEGLRGYCASGMNLFDAAVVAVSVAEILVSRLAPASRQAAGLTALRCARLVRIFKLSRQWRALNDLIKVVSKSISSLAYLSLLLLLYMFIFALLGQQLFSFQLSFCDFTGVSSAAAICPPGQSCSEAASRPSCYAPCDATQAGMWVLYSNPGYGGLPDGATLGFYPDFDATRNSLGGLCKAYGGNETAAPTYLVELGLAYVPHGHFNNLYNSWVTIFRLLTLDNWVNLQWACMRALGPWAAVYFVVTILIGVYILVNLFLAILLENFQRNARLHEMVAARGAQLKRHAADAAFAVAQATAAAAEAASAVDAEQNVVDALVPIVGGQSSPDSIGPDSAPPRFRMSLAKLVESPVESGQSNGPARIDSQGMRSSRKVDSASFRAGSGTTAVAKALELHGPAAEARRAADAHAELEQLFAAHRAQKRDRRRTSVSMRVLRGDSANASAGVIALEEAQLEALGELLTVPRGYNRSQSGLSDPDSVETDNPGRSGRLGASRVLHRSVSRDQPASPLLSRAIAMAQALVEHRVFSTVVMLCILANSMCLVLDKPLLDPNGSTKRVLDQADLAFVVIFAVEAVLKIAAYGFCLCPGAYLRIGWNRLDFFIVLVGVASQLLLHFHSGNANSNVSALRAARSLRALRPLRLVQGFPNMRLVVDSLLATIPGIGNVLVLTGLVYLVFGILGLELFMGKLWYCQDMNGNLMDSTAYAFDPASAPDGLTAAWCSDGMDAVQHGMGSHWLLCPGGVPTFFAGGPSAWNCTAPQAVSWTLGSASGLNETAMGSFSCAAVDANATGWAEGSVVESACPPALYTHSWRNPEMFKFDDIGWSILCLFEMCTQESWTDVMYATQGATGVGLQPVRSKYPENMLFCVIYMMVGSFFLVNLFVGVTIDKFNEIKEKAKGRSLLLTESQERWVRVQRLLAAARPETVVLRRRGSLSSVTHRIVTADWFEKAILGCIVVRPLPAACLDSVPALSLSVRRSYALRQIP